MPVPAVATVRQVSCSASAPAASTVPQQGAFSAPPSLAVCSHKEAVDYLTKHMYSTICHYIVTNKHYIITEEIASIISKTTTRKEKKIITQSENATMHRQSENQWFK